MKFTKSNASYYGRRGGIMNNAYNRRHKSRIFENGLYPVYVMNKFRDKKGRCYAVIERPIPQDFIVARGFDEKTGTWGQGEYGYMSRGLAIKRARKLAYKK